MRLLVALEAAGHACSIAPPSLPASVGAVAEEAWRCGACRPANLPTQHSAACCLDQPAPASLLSPPAQTAVLTVPPTGASTTTTGPTWPKGARCRCALLTPVTPRSDKLQLKVPSCWAMYWMCVHVF